MKKTHLESRIFFDKPVEIARYDKVKYPIFDGFTKQQRGFFWQPEEIDVYRDAKDFKPLTKPEQRIFTLNIKRQIVLDTKQGQEPVLAFGPIVSLPEVETWLTTWQFSETIHSQSYTHIIQNVYPDAGAVFDEILDIEELVDCARDIGLYYDELKRLNTLRAAKDSSYNEYEHKKALWRALISVNALEGIRFYVSFACSWAFAETKRMEGNAKIIKLICRDENLHLGSTQQLIKILPKDDPDFKSISEELFEESIQIYRSVVEQEVTWAQYLFSEGAMIGLNCQLLTEFLYWIANKRMAAINLPTIYEAGRTNPLPWTQKWISGSDVQDAPQETQIVGYTVGGIEKNLTPEFIRELRLD